jgi:hypothetical protein
LNQSADDRSVLNPKKLQNVSQLNNFAVLQSIELAESQNIIIKEFGVEKYVVENVADKE